MKQQVLEALNTLARRRAEQDRALEISRPDTVLPRHLHWQTLHKLSAAFRRETQILVESVVESANTALNPNGFTIEIIAKLRLLQGEAEGFGCRIVSSSGIEPTGTLTFKLKDSGLVRVEAEGLPLKIRFGGEEYGYLELELHRVTKGHIEAALLNFIEASLDGPQHAFAEDG